MAPRMHPHAVVKPVVLLWRPHAPCTHCRAHEAPRTLCCRYVLIDAARAGVLAAITGRVVGAVKSHFNSVVIEAGGAPHGTPPQ